MKVLITGATGAIGSFVVSELEDRYELILFTRRPVETRHHLVLGDLTSLADCQRALAGVEAVLHLGAISEPSPDTFRVNVMGTYYLMEAARSQGVRRVVMASTNCVYGHCFRVSDRPFAVEFLPIEETHSCRPEDNYGLSKLVGEEILATYSRAWGIQTVALRLAWVWGSKEIRWRVGLPALDLARYAPYFWAYVDVRDAARAFRLALEARQLLDHAVYNISAADTMAEEDSCELVARFYSGLVEKTHGLEGWQSFFSWVKARQSFGYEPQYCWRDGWREE